MKKCDGVKHNYEDICTTKAGDFGLKVVLWCRDCGATRIDYKGFNGERKVGYFQKGRIPNKELKVLVTDNSEEGSIDSLGLSARLVNCLNRRGFCTIEDLLTIEPEMLPRIRNLGAISYIELMDKMVEIGETRWVNNCNEYMKKHKSYIAIPDSYFKGRSN